MRASSCLLLPAQSCMIHVFFVKNQVSWIQPRITVTLNVSSSCGFVIPAWTAALWIDASVPLPPCGLRVALLRATQTTSPCPTSTDALFNYRLQLRRARVVTGGTNVSSFVSLGRILCSVYVKAAQIGDWIMGQAEGNDISCARLAMQRALSHCRL